MCIHVLCTSFVKELSSTYAFKTPEIALYLQAPFKVELYGCVVAGEWGGGGSTTDIPKSNHPLDGIKGFRHSIWFSFICFLFFL
jgi:hypothetical protein